MPTTIHYYKVLWKLNTAYTSANKIKNTIVIYIQILCNIAIDNPILG